MIAPIAREDYEALLEAGLPATLDDFDRLNTIALRIQCGPDTTAANFPRVGWAGDIPFHQPTCAAISWYWGRVDRAPFCTELKNSCWHFALAHGRKRGAFDGLDSPEEITAKVENWLATVNATPGEMARACYYAVNGFDDAEAEKTDSQKEKDASMTRGDMRDSTVGAVESLISRASAFTGVPPHELEIETTSRLSEMIKAVERLHKQNFTDDEKRLRDDYDRTHRSIVMRLKAEKKRRTEGGNV